MKTVYFLAAISLTLLLAACATIEGAGELDQGRQALLEGHYKRAVRLFEEGKETDLAYVYGAELRAGVLSYLGRTQYLTGNYSQARATLTKALSQHRTDNVARLYLGLTLYRLGDRKTAITDIQCAMQGIYSWIDYINTNFSYSFGKDWDENGSIRSGIRTDLAMMSSGNMDWPQLVSDGEKLGMGIDYKDGMPLGFHRFVSFIPNSKLLNAQSSTRLIRRRPCSRR